jgi:hypothetical protein
MNMYEEDYSQLKECWGCEEKENTLEDLKYWFKCLLSHLYDSLPLDLDEIERSLEEIGSLLEIKVPVSPIFPIHAVSPPVKDTHEWVKWNVDYFKKLAINS